MTLHLNKSIMGMVQDCQLQGQRNTILDPTLCTVISCGYEDCDYCRKKRETCVSRLNNIYICSAMKSQRTHFKYCLYEHLKIEMSSHLSKIH